MKYNIYAIKDTITGRFSPIEIRVNDGEAKRWFNNLMAENVNKKDYQLFYLGEYNIETGEVSSKVDFIIGGENE